MSYGPFQSVDWTIPTGVTAIHGSNDAGEGISSNGAGKTRLLEILPIALWGPSLPWSEYVPSGSGGLTTEVGCEFEHAGETYRVRRRYNPKGRGLSETHFERFELAWEPLTRSSQAETQAEISRVLGLTEETFAHSVFSKQGARHFADPTLTPRERKEILAEALGLGLYDTLQTLVRTDLREAESGIAANEAQAELLQAELTESQTAHLSVDDYSALVAEAETDLAGASESVQEFKTLYETARSARDALQPAQEILTARQRSLQLAEQQVEKERRLRDEAGQRALTERERLLRGAQGDRQESLRLRAEADGLKSRSESLLQQAKTSPETCDRCGQPVKGEALKALVDGLFADAAALNAKARESLEKAVQFETSAAVEVERADEIALPGPDEPFIPSETVQESISAAQQETNEARWKLEELQAGLPSDEHVKTIAAQVVAMEITESEAKRKLAAAQTSLGHAQAFLQRLDLVREKHAALANETIELRTNLALLRELEKAYGRDGIPALIMESTAIPKIEREAERVLDRLGVPFRVELRTQAALKTSDRLRDTLEVIVHEPAGERRYESFSGGERARINVALRLGLANLLAHRRGAEIEVFALDEVEHLDGAGIARLAELLSELQAEIPVILFISHVEQLSEAFDTAVMVEKRDGVSRLVTV